jgi:hypothetical protein
VRGLVPHRSDDRDPADPGRLHCAGLDAHNAGGGLSQM